MSEFRSELITLEHVVQQQFFFNIPIYQRLYVWGKEQIHTLLDDLVQAFEEGKSVFYLGGAIVIERESSKIIANKETFLFDLIDGQQRFTTLWLMSVVMGNELTDYCQVQTETGIRSRIDFAIRPQVTEFFQRILRKEQANLPEARQLEDALDEIHAFMVNYKSNNKIELDCKKFTKFIRNNVQLVLTRVPKNTDLNKLFEVINNRGVQLQHHEILKAKLLKFLDDEERECYGYLWDACSNMNDYVERNLRSASKVNTVSLFQNNQLAKSESVLAELRKLQKNQVLTYVSLETLLRLDSPKLQEKVSDEDATELPDRVNSIISFSMLLQHVLRIFLNRQVESKNTDIDKISDKDLLDIFKKYFLENEPTSGDVKNFISLLWEARYQFDIHIIKWVMVEEEKVHSIRRLYVNSSKENSYLQRNTTDAEPDFALLQSMLYHSQQMTTQYWLTPLLNYLLRNGDRNSFLYLKHLDNNLLCSKDKASLIERTRKYIMKPWHTEILIPAAASLNQKFDNGVEYPHYWFYKLEYVLYLQMKSDANLSRLTDNFRMTSKNSVEHIAPQNPENVNDNVEADALHNFGNLALVTRSLNSELSNKGYIIKQAEFKHRHQGRGVSLKLEYVFRNEHWTKIEIEAHQQEMTKYFDAYLARVSAAALQHGENS